MFVLLAMNDKFIGIGPFLETETAWELIYLLFRLVTIKVAVERFIGLSSSLHVQLALQIESLSVAILPVLLTPILIVTIREHDFELGDVTEIELLVNDKADNVMVLALTESVFWSVFLVILSQRTVLFEVWIFFLPIVKVEINKTTITFISKVSVGLIFDNVVDLNSSQITKTALGVMLLGGEIFESLHESYLFRAPCTYDSGILEGQFLHLVFGLSDDLSFAFKSGLEFCSQLSDFVLIKNDSWYAFLDFNFLQEVSEFLFKFLLFFTIFFLFFLT